MALGGLAGAFLVDDDDEAAAFFGGAGTPFVAPCNQAFIPI